MENLSFSDKLVDHQYIIQDSLYREIEKRGKWEIEIEVLFKVVLQWAVVKYALVSLSH